MAYSKLNKTIWRETSEKIGGKPLLAALSEDQELILHVTGSRKPLKRVKLIDLCGKTQKENKDAEEPVSRSEIIEDIQEWTMVSDFTPEVKTKLFEFFKRLKTDDE